jgi:hypothetical protein
MHKQAGTLKRIESYNKYLHHFQWLDPRGRHKKGDTNKLSYNQVSFSPTQRERPCCKVSKATILLWWKELPGKLEATAKVEQRTRDMLQATYCKLSW